MSSPRHYLEGDVRWPLTVTVVGCGGNGAQMLSGLAAIEIALKELGDRSISVEVYDNDVVTTANIGRQPFFPCDVGRNKADVLVERINIAYGFNWISHPRAVDEDADLNRDLVISCVDTIKARQIIYRALQLSRRTHSKRLGYWMDLGNTEMTGQAVLGRFQEKARSKATQQPAPLPHFFELFPHLLEDGIQEDNAPSCSLAEALSRQSLFVNRNLAAHALAMLYDLLVKGSVGFGGFYLNLKTGITMPMPLKAIEAPRKRARSTRRAA
ncbi:PRTRC system ThiF family protein [uncultured Bosea sp.]|uniref:PRTRC system ThiF family protein n=1 Tax=uncultured Bosea sp. TaxID=211457 RepID=UPI0025ED5BC3|nr:PRTRC system ThiF family protein [uncultured Bosea sp.]